MPEVKAICGLSRSSIYHLIQQGHFPAPVAIGGRARAWIKHEVEGWVAQRIRASRPQA
ncbi:AlpA family phage regulatory protein [Duganella sp. FT27W]|nr:AlpA family phage regulatory protein [Duganella sp. FT27W]